ncbi:MAG: glycosyltransferase family 2 protein [Actinobacteria bacterium]|nr:glycosyltransferase family 2 protein [Actinomycetota bacterium]
MNNQKEAVLGALLDISIIIVNYNSLDFIKKCISSIREHTGKNRLTYEILVVDNNSSDGSVEYLKEQVKKNNSFYLIANKNNEGFSRASNMGALKAKGEYLLFLNPDTRFISGSLGELVDFYSKEDRTGRPGVVGAKILNSDGTLQFSSRSFPTLARQFYESYFLYRIFKKSRIFGSYFLSWWDHNSQKEVDWVAGSFMFIRKDYFMEAGMFDEDYFMYSEDSDLCLKLYRKGYKNYYFPYFVIEHADSGIASGNMAAREAGIWKSRRLYFKKNYSAVYAGYSSFLYLAGVLNRILLFIVLSIFKPGSKNRARLAEYFRVLRLYFKG